MIHVGGIACGKHVRMIGPEQFQYFFYDLYSRGKIEL